MEDCCAHSCEQRSTFPVRVDLLLSKFHARYGGHLWRIYFLWRLELPLIVPILPSICFLKTLQNPQYVLRLVQIRNKRYNIKFSWYIITFITLLLCIFYRRHSKLKGKKTKLTRNRGLVECLPTLMGVSVTKMQNSHFRANFWIEICDRISC